MNAFLGWALKLELDFFGALCMPYLMHLGEQIWRLDFEKNKVSVGRSTECMLGVDFRARFGMIFGYRQMALLRADFQARVERIFGSR